MNWSSGIISETCSCGAEISAPANEVGKQMVESWREKHRHDRPRPELKSLGDTSRVHRSGGTP